MDIKNFQKYIEEENKEYLIFGGCVLNKLHFKKHKNTIFLYPYLRMMGFKTPFKKTRIIMRYVVPIVVIGVAIFWQVVLGHSPLYNNFIG